MFMDNEEEKDVHGIVEDNVLLIPTFMWISKTLFRIEQF